MFHDLISVQIEVQTEVAREAKEVREKPLLKKNHLLKKYKSR